MKVTTALKSIALIAALGVAMAVPVLAQPGPGMGGGGMGPGTQNAGQAQENAGPGMGPRGRGGRGMRFNQNNMQGWTLMTPAERTAQQTRMRAVKTYDECKLVQAEHRSAMEARAKEKGVTLPVPRQNGCDNMKARGFIK